MAEECIKFIIRIGCKESLLNIFWNGCEECPFYSRISHHGKSWDQCNRPDLKNSTLLK